MRLALLFALALPIVSEGAVKDPDALVKKAEYNLRGEYTQGISNMKVVRSSGIRTLRFRFFSKGDDYSMVRIIEPVKDKGITNLRKEQSLWQFLPKVNRTIRVPTSLMLQSWMGSDFSNDDIAKASSWARDYTSKVLQENADGVKGLVKLELTPKKGAAIVWGKIHLLVRESDAAFLKEEFFKESGELVKTLTAAKHVTLKDQILPLYYKMTNPNDKEAYTEITFDSKTIKINEKIPNAFFSEAKMREMSW